VLNINDDPVSIKLIEKSIIDRAWDEGWVIPRPAQRRTDRKVAVVGSGRMREALDILGFGPCHHMEEILSHPEQVEHWQAFVAGKPVVWDEVFKGYRSQIDWPGAHVWRELADAYPQAKVIHSIRPEDAWWTSFSATIGKLLTVYKDMPLPAHVAAMLAAMEIALIQQTFGCPPTDREGVLAAYRRRTEQVRAAIPPERLLVFEVTEGWEPLCAFLEGVTSG
jgi:hypothetical protein